VPDSAYVTRWSFNLFYYFAFEKIGKECPDQYKEDNQKRLIAYGILELMQVALQQHSGDEGACEW
jgi:hypothetical protein